MIFGGHSNPMQEYTHEEGFGFVIHLFISIERPISFSL